MDVNKLSKYYLCGIGNKEVDDYKIGIYDSKYKSFSFSNGSDSNMSLYTDEKGTHIISAVCLTEIDDNELLNKLEV